MIGNRVRVILDGGREITGTLHRLDAPGATVWREHPLPEGQGTVFVPMHRIHEIIDLGRAP